MCPAPADLGRRILATQLITLRGYGQTFVLEVNLKRKPRSASRSSGWMGWAAVR